MKKKIEFYINILYRLFAFLTLPLLFLASCSSDEDVLNHSNGNGIITNQKKLSKIELRWERNLGFDYKTVMDFPLSSNSISYDPEGKVEGIHELYTYDKKYYTKFFFNDNIITTQIINEDTGNASGKDNTVNSYTLENNLVRKTHINKNRNDSEWNYSTFTYNSLNQLIKVESISLDDKKTTENIVWENNRIIEISYTTEGDEENAYIKRFTYSDKKCEGFCPLFFLRNCNMLAYAHPELMGIRCNQLPDSEKFIRIDDNGEEVTYRNYTYSYTFDNDGYVTSCTQKGLNIYAIVTFTWLDY